MRQNKYLKLEKKLVDGDHKLSHLRWLSPARVRTIDW